jgi:hypothetical protein
MDTIPIQTPFAKQFFSSYLVDHFLYKQYALFNIVEKYASLKDQVLDGLAEIEDDKVLKSLRLEIRATYFQAIETLFELIFSLEPRRNIIDNRNIWYFLSTSQWRKNYKRIKRIAAGDTAFLDRAVVAGKNLKIPFLQYLFYFGVTNPSMLDAVRGSSEPIKKFLVAFAKEFSERDEYNAFKHALRILPTVQKLEAIPHGAQKPILTIDMSDSVSFLDDVDGAITLHLRPLDTIRDMRMGLVCSNLISNIVLSRRVHFIKDYSGYLHTFSNETFPSANERNAKWMNFEFSIKPIYNEPVKPQGNEDRAGA